MPLGTYMLYGVGHARHATLIAKVADTNIESRASLVRFRIMNEQGFQAVVEADNSIVAVVEGRLLEAVGQQHD